MNTALMRMHRMLARRVDGASLAVFRILFGACMTYEVAHYFDSGWIDKQFVEPIMTFKLPGFEFLQLLPPTGMYTLFAVMGVAAVCVMLGLWYRVAITTLFLTHLYVFVIDETNYLNHFYLIALIAFLLIGMPADRVFTLRRRSRERRVDDSSVPFWTVFLLRAQLFIVYFYAGIAKLSVDWLQGQPLNYWFADSEPFPIIGLLLREYWFTLVLSYAGLAYDLSVGFLLMFRRTQVLGLLLSATFHFMNIHLFDIGIFPWLAMGATLIFLEPGWPRTITEFVRRRFKPRAGDVATFATPGPAPWHGLRARTTGFVIAWIAVQALIPLRHWLYPGNVNWTEEGHILSWRMLLRDKTGELRSVTVVQPRTGERIAHDPREHLTRLQYRKLPSHPRMLHGYAHWLADRQESLWGARPQIYVNALVSLNGRRNQPMIDSTTDLASVRMTEGNNPWILPLSVPLADRAENTAANE